MSRPYIGQFSTDCQVDREKRLFATYSLTALPFGQSIEKVPSIFDMMSLNLSYFLQWRPCKANDRFIHVDQSLKSPGTADGSYSLESGISTKNIDLSWDIYSGRSFAKFIRSNVSQCILSETQVKIKDFETLVAVSTLCMQLTSRKSTTSREEL